MDHHGNPRRFNRDHELSWAEPSGNKAKQARVQVRFSLQHSLLNIQGASVNVQSEARLTDTPISSGTLSMPPPAPPTSLFLYQQASTHHLGMDESRQSKHNGSANVVESEATLQASPKDNRLSAESNSLQHPAKHARQANELESNRLSFSSLFSMGSAVHNGATSIPNPSSGASSVAGSVRSSQLDPTSAAAIPAIPLSPSTGSTRVDAASGATTAMDAVSVTASHSSQSSNPATRHSTHATSGSGSRNSDSWDSGSLPRLQNSAPDRRSRSRTQRRPSGSVTGASASPSSKDRSQTHHHRPSKYKIGVCALDIKARSKPSRNILTRLQNNGEFEIIVFGDKVILDEDVENWPLCDFLISFFSDGFPLDKAIAYAQLRKPLCVNDLPMQKVLWDRRLCLRILDQLEVPTPRRIEVNRDGGPKLESPALAEHVQRMSGVKLEGPSSGMGGGLPVPSKIELSSDTDTLIVDGMTLRKPFVEKPVSGEDHNVHIYFPRDMNGGGGRRLFRKIGNKSSEWDPDLVVPRSITDAGSSYVYEQFLDVDNAEDVKAYTVGPNFCHAETRKSPVVDGVVRRNTHGKEIRYITALSPEEAIMASKIADGFGQRICGFDLLRTGNKSFVIDVNGWSFVKDNNEYYDKSASILRQIFYDYSKQKQRRDASKASTRGDTDTSGETAPDTSQPRQVGTHRATLKGLFKSPSLQKLRHNSNQKDKSNVASPVPSGANTPLISPNLPTTAAADQAGRSSSASDTLLPPVIGEPRSLGGSSDSQTPVSDAPLPAAKHSWKLKGMVSVIRHADRTPKQKFKFTFHTQPFIDLLKGHQEEVLLKGEAALSSVMSAVKIAIEQGIEDPEKLNLLRTSLARKGAWTGTKVQIKPMFKKRKLEESGLMATEAAVKNPGLIEDEPEHKLRNTRSDSLTGVTLSRFSAAEDNLVFDKLQLIIKWGGEPTHAARYQAHDLGENMRNDLLLMNRETLNNVRVFTSSERRVSTSAQIWAASFLEQKEIPDSFISVRKDLLDDSNAAKDIMDKVKKKLKVLLREGHDPPPQFAWPANTPEPAVVVRRVTELMKFHRSVMRYNFNKLGSSAAASLSALNKVPESASVSATTNGMAMAQAQAVANIQARWCCGEDAELFKERWEKLFAEFTDPEKIDPSKISELYDAMKFDALHNRQFLEWVFTPSQNFLDDFIASGKAEPLFGEGFSVATSRSEESASDPAETLNNSSKPGSDNGKASNSEKTSSQDLAQRMNFRRKSVTSGTSPLLPQYVAESESYFKLFRGGGQSRAKQDARLKMLRELYRYAKILFDYVCPQEYGISDSEKLEIGLLTSLPLLREITSDLEEVQASEDAKTFIYFTKESHIYTLLNAILEGGVKSKISRNAIPELDYLSQICFELYEAEDKDSDTFAYSIRISLSPGCHTADPLDLQLDSKHAIGCAPRRSLTAHADWKEVIETLRDKFTAVKLPKSFLAINLSDKHAREAEKESGEEEPEDKDPVDLLGQENEITESALSGPDRDVSVADLEAESVEVHKGTTQEADEACS